VLFTGTAGILSSSLDDRGLPAQERDQIVSAVVDSSGGAIAGLAANPATAPIAADAKAAFSDATRLSAFTAGGFSWWDCSRRFRWAASGGATRPTAQPSVQS
jgi:hypothetical protein